MKSKDAGQGSVPRMPQDGEGYRDVIITGGSSLDFGKEKKRLGENYAEFLRQLAQALPEDAPPTGWPRAQKFVDELKAACRPQAAVISTRGFDEAQVAEMKDTCQLIEVHVEQAAMLLETLGVKLQGLEREIRRRKGEGIDNPFSPLGEEEL